MLNLSFVVLLNSCAYISNDDVNFRLDPDQDGLGWEDDCEENNPYLSEPLEWYLDADEDGYGDPLNTLSACVQPEGYLSNNNDCNDDPENNGALFNPAAPEICDSVDNNCNGLIDDDDDTLSGNNYWYVDNDGDGEGSSETSMLSCFSQDGWAQNTDDCDDNNANISTYATEICDGLDNDCDSEVDEDLGETFYLDADLDGYGSQDHPITLCELQEGFSENNEDCDDVNPARYPDAEEICDYIDNDCDGTIDEGAALLYHQDLDEDGYGNPFMVLQLCELEEGASSNNEDCDDLDPEINPDQEEICDGLDNNCDGQADEGVSLQYLDADGDGYGDPQISSGSCFQEFGYVGNDKDCNDTNPDIHPLAGDFIDDLIDTDCDGLSCEAAPLGSAYFAVCQLSFWSEAALVCASGGYHFGSIQSSSENDLVQALTLTASAITGVETVWLGYTDLAQEGSWVWEDGYSGSYTNWMSNEPNNGNGNEDCAVMMASEENGGWNDESCLVLNQPALCTVRSTTSLNP